MDRAATGKSVLDEQVVKDWLGMAVDIDKELCTSLRFLILRQSVGTEPPPVLLEQIKVGFLFFPSPRPVADLRLTLGLCLC
jgi:hypothetical protein